MKQWIAERSLGVRMVGLFSALLLAIGLFMFAFFPSRMADQARGSAEHRAAAIAQVMSTALGPALEFDDADNATEILAWLETMPDARFGVVRHDDGTRFAAWRAHAIPPAQVWSSVADRETRGALLIVTVPIVGLGGGAGTLHVGFSLDALADERARTRRTVGAATATVFVLGLLATLVLAAVLVRPIRRLTETARRISRGELPPHLPIPDGADEVAQMTGSLSRMLDRLNEVNQQLQRASRHAGMAEVATGVLHNVGNVLNSVNVAVELMRSRTRELPVARLARLEELLGKTVAGGAIDRDQLALATRYVGAVTRSLEQSRDESLAAIDGLRGHLDHIKAVVAMQNAYARPGGIAEPSTVDALVAEAIKLGGLHEQQHAIALTVDAPPRAILVDRHRVLQIIVNLVSNARDAVLAAPTPPSIAVTAAIVDGALRIVVVDSGVGIAADAIDRIFAAGFTTKPRGHGYGLHSSALAAGQLGGTLTVASPGPGLGATFTLTVPVEVVGA